MSTASLKHKPKILYIEDTAAARILVSRVLASEYQVIEAEEPLEGINVAIQAKPDLILLDINLPHLSGVEVATRLHTLLPGTPLVALTADVSVTSRERALAAGCYGYLTKPIDIETFPDQIAEFLGGKREILPDIDKYRQEYQADLVARLEHQVRELTRQDEQNTFLLEQNNHIISVLKRRQRLLEAGAIVAHSIASILDLDTLLSNTVDIICREFEFYYSGIFLIDNAREYAVLRAGHGLAGAAMIAAGHKLALNGDSMVGTAIARREARISDDVGQVAEGHFKNPHLPGTRSEMAMPLILDNNVLGVLTVQSQQVNAFRDDDITALQSMADQIAVAISNAQLLQDLDTAHKELVRTKTFEAIATATGETIHWVGNKAAPIPGSVYRIREDLNNLLAMCQVLLDQPDATRETHPFWGVVQESFAAAAELGIDLPELAAQLAQMKPRRLQFMGSVESIFEDLAIIDNSSRVILEIKEDLIGPVRLQNIEPVDVLGLVQDVVGNMGLPDEAIRVQVSDDLPKIAADQRQLNRVLINLIKNAWEALQGARVKVPEIVINAEPAEDGKFMLIRVIDNGPGIPPEVLEKIWVSFFTTKGNHGGTGLGLSACMEIINQANGKIWVESEVGHGAAFHILLPIAKA